MNRAFTDTIVVHGAWTPASLDIGAAEIREWHVKERGYDDIGYHFVIRRDGTLEPGRPQDQWGAHVQGHNTHTVGICLVGGKDVLKVEKLDFLPETVKQEALWEFNYTMEQLDALDYLLYKLLQDYPQVTRIVGHRDFPGVTKRCPGFEVAALVGSPQDVLDRVYHGE